MTTTTSRIYRYECWDIQFVPHIRFQTVTLYSQIALQTEFRSKDHTWGVSGCLLEPFFQYPDIIWFGPIVFLGNDFDLGKLLRLGSYR